MVGAMGAMAACAVIGNRGVLPQKGPALVSMTAVATVVQGGLFQHGGIERTVGLMAVRARHVTETHRMGRHLVRLNLHIPVTVGADFRFTPGDGDRIFADMHLVTVRASYVLSLMGSAIPVHALISLVAVETDTVLFLFRPERIVAEGRNGRALLIKAEPLPVLSSRPMAGFTLVLCKWRPCIPGHRMGRLENIHHRDFAVFIMAGQAGVSAFRGIFQGRIRFVLRHHLNAGRKQTE